MLDEATVWRPTSQHRPATQVLVDPRYVIYLAGWPRHSVGYDPTQRTAYHLLRAATVPERNL